MRHNADIYVRCFHLRKILLHPILTFNLKFFLISNFYYFFKKNISN